MQEVKIEGPVCAGCGRRIVRPRDADMGLYRLGLNVHTKCLKIWANVEGSLKRRMR